MAENPALTTASPTAAPPVTRQTPHPGARRAPAPAAPPGHVARPAASSSHRCCPPRPGNSNHGPATSPGQQQVATDAVRSAPPAATRGHRCCPARLPPCTATPAPCPAVQNAAGSVSRPARPARPVPGRPPPNPGLMLAGPARAAPCRAAWRPAALTGQPPRHEALTGHSQVTLTPTSRRRWVRRRFGQGWLHDHGRCLGSPPHAGVVRRPGHLAGEISGHLTSCRVMKTFTTSSPGAHVVPALGFRLPSRAVVAVGRAVARRTRFGSHGRQWSGAAGACDAC